MVQFPATVSNFVLNVEKDGTVIYSNTAGEPLLHEWGIRVGEKLPAHIRDFAQMVILQNIPKKTEIETENRVLLLFFQPLSEEEHVNIYGYDISDRKKLEEALRESEQKLNHIIKHAPTGIFEIDFDGPKYINVNDAFCQMSGYTREELLATNPFELIDEESRDKLKERIRKSFAGEEITSQEEYLVKGKNGRKLWVLINAHFTYRDGKAVGAVVIAHDITERKQAEKALCKSERHYRILFETMLQGIVYHDADGRVISMNPAAERILGNNPAEFLDTSQVDEECYTIREDGTPFPAIEHPAMVSLMRGHEVHNVVMGVYNPREKRYRWVNTSAIPVIVLGEDKPFQVYTLLDDVTERRQAEEALRESEEKYRNIVETANEGILVIDDEALITFANKKMTDMLGYSLEESIGRPIWDFTSEEYRDKIKLNFCNKRWQGINGSYELKLLRKDGSSLWVFINAKPLFDKDGEYTGSMGMFTDITKIKDAEQDLANIEIVRKKEIHHRIKNNLQVISSLIDLQADKFKGKKNITDSEVLQAFKESQDRVKSMSLIHEELYKGGDTDTVNFSSYIKELTDNLFLTYKLENTDVSLYIDLEENVFFDMDTAVPLGIIVNELISNSLKHAFIGRNKGEIRIKLIEDDTGKYKSEGFMDNFILTVSDNGVGISLDLDFEELDSLGLQLVISLADQLDGELEIKRNNGTEFIIRFTVEENNNQTSVTAAQHSIE